MNKPMRVHVLYSGHVQGIGFRFTARAIAHELEITGWIKNRNDSRVEIIAEQQEEVLKQFLTRLQHSFSRYIQDVDVSWQPSTGEFNGFTVEFI